MTAKDVLLPEFDQEMAATRLVLERIPDISLGWRPHDRGRNLGGLAAHLAQIPRWGVAILGPEAHDLAEPGPLFAVPPASVAAVLDRFDRHVREARAALAEAPDGHLLTSWALTRGRHLVLSVPRVAAIRAFVLHHTIHHRGQLTVYLRMLGVELPTLYGPTAGGSM